MKMTFRWHGSNSDSVTLQQIKQIPGMTGPGAVGGNFGKVSLPPRGQTSILCQKQFDR